jgi:CRP-like cAMP-binding protein
LCGIESGDGAGWAQKAPEELQKALVEAGDTRQLEGGCRLFAFGEEASGVFLILQGRARAVLPGGAGRELLRLTAGPGSLLGVPSALCAKNYQFDVEALEPLDAVFVPVTQLNDLLRQRPELGMQVMGMMCEELSALGKTREHLSRCENRECGLYCQCKQAAALG